MAKEKEFEDEVWESQDGREIPVGEMEEEHVRAVLRLLIRNRRKQRARINKMQSTLRLIDEKFGELESHESLADY